MTDYRKMTKAQLDAAILYQVTYGRDLQALDHLIAARNFKEQASVLHSQEIRLFGTLRNVNKTWRIDT